MKFTRRELFLAWGAGLLMPKALPGVMSPVSSPNTLGLVHLQQRYYSERLRKVAAPMFRWKPGAIIPTIPVGKGDQIEFGPPSPVRVLGVNPNIAQGEDDVKEKEGRGA